MFSDIINVKKDLLKLKTYGHHLNKIFFTINCFIVHYIFTICKINNYYIETYQHNYC
jgi:hypothetical protein